MSIPTKTLAGILTAMVFLVVSVQTSASSRTDNLKPIPIIKIDGQTSNFTVTVGETVTFDGFDSYDPDCGTSGCISDFQWYFDPPGPYISRDSIYAHVFSQPDTIVVKLTVRDDVMPYKHASLEVDLVILAQGNPPDLPNEYYVKDHLGSIRAAVDEDGFIAKQSDYYPFGLRMPGRILIEGSPVREGYTGHELDDETGLNYAGARYLDTEIGRWLSVDPLAEKHPDWTPYNYVLASPLRLKDPDGRQIDSMDGALHARFLRDQQLRRVGASDAEVAEFHKADRVVDAVATGVLAAGLGAAGSGMAAKVATQILLQPRRLMAANEAVDFALGVILDVPDKDGFAGGGTVGQAVGPALRQLSRSSPSAIHATQAVGDLLNQSTFTKFLTTKGNALNFTNQGSSLQAFEKLRNDLGVDASSVYIGQNSLGEMRRFSVGNRTFTLRGDSKLTRTISMTVDGNEQQIVVRFDY